MSDFLQLTISGLALGCQYALVAVGFTVIMKSSGVLSIFQGGLVLLGAYLTYQAHQGWGWPFFLAVAMAVAVCAALNLLAESQVLSRIRVRSNEVLIFLTFGLLLAVQPLVESMWGSDILNLGDPWGLRSVQLGPVTVTERDLWTIGASVIALGGVFLLFNKTRIGLAMRAAASDPEAATAQGISPRLTQGVSWALAGALAAFAGVLMATAVGGGVRPGLADVAFAALPAIYLGGLNSPIGAVVGGLLIGLTQQWAAGYAPDSFGQGFSAVFPYLVMVVILLVRPQGIFGGKVVSRA